MTKETPLREIALGILLEVTEEGHYSHLVINETLKKYQYLEKQDRAFLSRLCEGTIETLIHLDYIIEQFSTVKVKKMKPVIRNILRMGVYQIKFMDSVPDSAACNEAVKLGGKKGFQNLKGFINGVLRNISRKQNEISYPLKEKEPIKYFSILYSTPEWIIESWQNEFGIDITEKILKASLEDKKTTIRCNLNKTTPAELQGLLRAQGINVEDGAYLPYALKISGYNYMNTIEGFNQGLFQIQDESSMLAVEIADIKKGSYILDVCAAPGGKSLHASEKIGNSGQVEARDLTEYKVSLVEENINRAGSSNVSTKVWDALVLDKDTIEKADVVIADLPCSGLGVFGKKTDIKYKMTIDQQVELANLQRQILSVVWQYVKKGGILIYSTCTINKEENLSNVLWFLEHYDFQLESLNPYLPEPLKSETTQNGYLNLLPGVHNTDGFFMARMKRQ